MKDRINDEAMRIMADLLKSLMPPNWGFTLITFETNNVAAKVNYISSANRDDMKGTMQTMLNKWNRGEDFTKPNLN